MVHTEFAPKRLQFHVAPAMPALKVQHFGGYSKTNKQTKRATKSQSLMQNHSASAVSLVKRAENSAIQAIINLRLWFVETVL